MTRQPERQVELFDGVSSSLRWHCIGASMIKIKYRFNIVNLIWDKDTLRVPLDSTLV